MTENIFVRLEREYKPAPPPDIVYHGTRCPKKILEQEGLRFNPDFVLQKIKEICEKIDVRFDDWKVEKKQKYFDSGCYMIKEINKSEIWVTDSIEKASSYSKRNPEILYYAVHSLMHFKYPRRWSKSFVQEIKTLCHDTVSKIGERKIIFLDNSHPSIGYVKGVNCPTYNNCIPKEAFIKIIDVKENE